LQYAHFPIQIDSLKNEFDTHTQITDCLTNSTIQGVTSAADGESANK